MSENQLLFLDTPVWIRWIEQDSRLPFKLREVIENFYGTVAISVVSVYEIYQARAQFPIFNPEANSKEPKIKPRALPTLPIIIARTP
ncbi:MAG: hypothetical protein ACRERV_11340 [Methylococcales bacterium]